jgi:uncharacterized protein (TIGR02757 family)
MRVAELRTRLDDLYAHYDHRFVDPDPLQFVRLQTTDPDREVVGLIASALAYGNVKQIKRSIARVVEPLGAHPAQAIDRMDVKEAKSLLRGFKHRFNDARDVACLLLFLKQMRREAGSVEGFFLKGPGPQADIADALTSFSERTLALDHGGLYAGRRLPATAGVRFFFPSPRDGSACKRLNLYLRWMVRKDGVDLGVWKRMDPAHLVIPLDAHIYTIARRVGLTRNRSPGWPMALDITRRLRKLDPRDPIKYDFAFHRMGLWKREEEIASLKK